MERLSDEEVLKVINLAKLNPETENIEELSYQLKQILNEVNKIEQLNISDTDILITPSPNKNIYYEDEVGIMLAKKDVLKNALIHDESYIEVVGVLND